MKPLFSKSRTNREIVNLEGQSLGMTIEEYNKGRPAKAKKHFHTLCHAPFAVMDLGPQGQVTTCNHFHRFIGNLNRDSWLDIFRGEDWTRLRQNMLDYKISELDCRHCSRQIRSGHPGNAFAQEHFDAYPAETADPKHPTVIIFRLSNVCNLKCVMCNGTLSHRIRKEREKLPPLPPPPYGEQFFQEMEETLPHVKYVEFYGGEPFLIKEHLRILDLIEKTGSKTEIYVNTNGTAITPKIKGYIERLNFVKIAVSVDAVSEVVQSRIRIGIKHDVCMENLQWMLELRKRKNIWIGLNTTETRFNWYHLPELFRFAANNDVYVHINTCLHPSDCTLYDLPSEELAYIDDYFERSKAKLGDLLKVRRNTQSYGHLQAMVRDELEARLDGRKRPNPYPTDRAPIHGGLMSVPELKAAPFQEPASVLEEIRQVEEFEAWAYALRMGQEWLEFLADEEDSGPWGPVRRELELLIARVEPLVPEPEVVRDPELDRAAMQAGWEFEQQGRLEEALAAIEEIPDESPRTYEALHLRARAQRRLGQTADCRVGLERAITLEPSRPEAHVELAWLFFDLREAGQGLEHARKARELTPNGEVSWSTAWAHALATVATASGEYDDTLSALDILHQVFDPQLDVEIPGDAAQRDAEEGHRCALEAAWEHEARGVLDAALAAADTVPDDSPRRYHALVLRARVQRRSNDLSAANASLALAIAIAPSRPEALVELAWSCLDDGRTESGLGFAKRARTLSAESGAMTHIGAWAHVLSLLAATIGDRDSTMAALDQLGAARGDNPETAATRAYALGLLEELPS